MPDNIRIVGTTSGTFTGCAGERLVKLARPPQAGPPYGVCQHYLIYYGGHWPAYSSNTILVGCVGYMTKLLHG